MEFKKGMSLTASLFRRYFQVTALTMFPIPFYIYEYSNYIYLNVIILEMGVFSEVSGSWEPLTAVFLGLMVRFPGPALWCSSHLAILGITRETWIMLVVACSHPSGEQTGVWTQDLLHARQVLHPLELSVFLMLLTLICFPFLFLVLGHTWWC